MPNRPVLVRTAAAVTAAVVVVGAGCFAAVLDSVTTLWSELQVTASRNQADRIADLLATRVREGETQESLLREMQASLTTTPADPSGFLCVLDERATVVCHPDPAAVGMSMTAVPTRDLEGRQSDPLGQRAAARREGVLRLEGMAFGGSEHLVYQRPVEGAPWLVSVHSNADAIATRVAAVGNRMLIVAVPGGLLLIVLCTIAVRAVARRYEQRIEAANAGLESAVARRTRDLESTVVELRRTQSALAQNEKLAVVGESLAGLAHELNGHLAVVVGYAELGRDQPRSKDAATWFTAIGGAGDRCSRLVRSFLDFVRNHPPRSEVAEIDELVTAASQLCAPAFRQSGVEIHLDLDARTTVFVDPLHIEQVFVNLMQNARQAIEGAGRPGMVAVRTRCADGWVRIEVADDGPGVPTSMRERLFEAFQTSKPVGVGTGLGLSLCRRFVSSHGGRIALASTGPKGTMFLVELPVACVGAAGERALTGSDLARAESSSPA